jgi:ABC-type phosphate transport system substrate-binding protein
MRAIHKIVVLGAALVAFGGIGVGTALADPYPPLSGPPATTSIVGVGSDTVTPLFSGNELYTDNSGTCTTDGGQTSGDLTQDYDATNPANLLYSWDAVNPCTGASGDQIVTKSGCASIARPDGSSAGITQLNVDTTDGTINGDTVYCIDYARSSRAPNATTFDDAFSKLATDSLAWSYPVISGETNPQPTSLTHAELVDIYNCTDTNWDQITGDTNNAPIVAVVPQSGSGTRATWLTDLGLTAFGSCVVNGVAANGDVIEENTGLSAGNVDQFTAAGAQDAIFPYSIGDWIAQSAAVTGDGSSAPGNATVGGHATSIWGHGNLALGETVNTLGEVEAAVTTNSDKQPVINPAWSSQFDRTLYAVVRNGFTDPTSSTDASWPVSTAYDSAPLKAIFGPWSTTTNTGGWACNPTGTDASDIVSYGFGLESTANCGSLTAGD